MPRWVFVLLLSLAWPSMAGAHNVVAAAWSAGDVIEGEIGFSNGELAPAGTEVRVLGPDGAELGRTSVDADGLFRFQPTAAVPHRFVANLGQGHVAEIELSVDELPVALANAATATQPAATVATTSAPIALDAATLEQIVATAVQRELAPIKRELARREQEASFQSIVSGLGYIAGIFGLLFFIYAHRQRR